MSNSLLKISKLLSSKSTLLKSTFAKSLTTSSIIRGKFEEHDQKDAKIYIEDREFMSNIPVLVEKFRKQGIPASQWAELYEKDFRTRVVQKKYDEINEVDENLGALFKQLCMDHNATVDFKEIESIYRKYLSKFENFNVDRDNIMQIFDNSLFRLNKMARSTHEDVSDSQNSLLTNEELLLMQKLHKELKTDIFHKIISNITFQARKTQDFWKKQNFTDDIFDFMLSYANMFLTKQVNSSELSANQVNSSELSERSSGIVRKNIVVNEFPVQFSFTLSVLFWLFQKKDSNFKLNVSKKISTEGKTVDLLSASLFTEAESQEIKEKFNKTEEKVDLLTKNIKKEFEKLSFEMDERNKKTDEVEKLINELELITKLDEILKSLEDYKQNNNMNENPKEAMDFIVKKEAEAEKIYALGLNIMRMKGKIEELNKSIQEKKINLSKFLEERDEQLSEIMKDSKTFSDRFTDKIASKHPLTMFLLTDSPSLILKIEQRMTKSDVVTTCLSRIDKKTTMLFVNLYNFLCQDLVIRCFFNTRSMFLNRTTFENMVDILKKPPVDSTFHLMFGVSVALEDYLTCKLNIDELSRMFTDPDEQRALVDICYFQLFATNILTNIVETFSVRRNDSKIKYLSFIDDHFQETNF